MKRLGIVGLALATFVSAGAPALAQGRGAWSLESDFVSAREERHRMSDRSFYAYEGLGYYSVSRSRHIGFFAQGGEAGAANGSGHFDYDRGYPYDHYSHEEAADEFAYVPREHWCSTQWVREGRERVPVRVCRN